ncbi:MAG: MmgE/PrpD family protein, partial [Alphaproteobacteria bacterium]|nr:MmgE/PrpD family protein [Alphaproteobacteria bacterium]
MDGAATVEHAKAGDLTRALAAQASAFSYQDLPDGAREIARQCILDYLAVAIAGAGDPLVRILLDELEEAGGSPQASLIGHQARLPALSAA